jgi:hypothetical protein
MILLRFLYLFSLSDTLFLRNNDLKEIKRNYISFRSFLNGMIKMAVKKFSLVGR